MLILTNPTQFRYHVSLMLIALFFIQFTAHANNRAAETIKQITSKASKGDKRAQYRLGVAYMNGSSVTYNRNKALRWLEKSAAQKYYKAWYKLGELYYDSVYGKQNYSVSFKWFFKPALRSHGISQYKVALLYYHGRGVTQNSAKALIWATRAKNHGIPTASALISRIHNKLSRDVKKSKQTMSAKSKRAKRPETKPFTLANIPNFLAISKWTSNGLASDYLPSNSTHCIEITGKIRCTSKLKKIKLPGYTADFRIVSLISNFRAKSKFTIRYRNKYISVLQDDPTNPTQAPSLGVGDKVFKIQCSLLRRNQVRCLKADYSVLKFTKT